MKTNRRKPEWFFHLVLPRAKYFGLIFILLLFSPLPFPAAGLPATGNKELGKVNPKLQLQHVYSNIYYRSCGSSSTWEFSPFPVTPMQHLVCGALKVSSSG